MKLMGKILITGVFCTFILGSCSRVPFEMVDTDNLWQDNYSQLENDSTYWINSKTYNVQDPSCRLIDDTFYIFSTDAIYLDLQAQMFSGRGNQNSDRMNRGGGPGGGFSGGGFPGFPGFGQENNRAQKSKDRVVVKREERMKMRAALMGEDTTTIVQDTLPTMDQPGAFMAGMPGGDRMRRGDTTGMAARRAAFAERMQQDGQRGANQPNGPQGNNAQQGARGGQRGGGFPGMGEGGFPGFGEGGFPGFGRRGMRGAGAGGMKIGDGFIQLRKSVDLANWEFAGWVFDSIPASAQEWLKGVKGRPINTTRAPFVHEYGGVIRLYYTLASQGFGPAYIGLAESESVYGPWEDKGCVMQSDFDSKAVAADPSIVEHDGKLYMYYGTSMSGIYCVELNSETGMLLEKGDIGECIAKGVEAAEVVYNDDNKYFYLFCSAGDSHSDYNIRVGRSLTPVGPFTDYEGKVVSGNSLPEVVTPYTFVKHEGWIGTGHASVFRTKRGDWYIAHNGRLAKDARIMDLHIRRMIFTDEGWPIVMPERYMGEKPFKFTAEEVCGGYEILCFNGNDSIPCKYLNIEIGEQDWSFDESEQILNLTLWNGEQLNGMMVFPGHDWERMSTSIQFVGMDEKGHTIWGKRVD